MDTLAFVLCIFAFPAVSLCETQGAAPVVNSPINSSIVYGEIGQPVTLTCTTANASDTIAWYFKNEPMSFESMVQGVLTLSPLQAKHGGWYTCAAANRFGRDEKDFLVIAGYPPMEVITFNSSGSIYRVPVGYYAELPCHFMGSPHPVIRWFNDTGDEIIAMDNCYEIINSTGSLIVHNSDQQSKTLRFYCTAMNMFDTSMSNIFTVEFLSVGQLSPPITFPLLNSTNHSLPASLSCTNRTNPVDSNYTVNWTRNLDPATVRNDDTLMVTDPGYYCCQISIPDLQPLHFCTTVFDTSSIPQLDSIEPARISLPLNRNRRVGLLCSGSTPNEYDPPLIEWFDGQSNPLMSADDLDVSTGTNGLGYLSSSRANQSTFRYTCQGSNNAGAISTSATVDYISTCSGGNVLQEGNAELSSEVNQYWTFTGSGASATTVHNENVFVLEYNGTTSAAAPSIAQTLAIPDPLSLTDIYISGRMRQVNGPSSGVATIHILIDNESTKNLSNPYPNVPSWQWVRAELTKSGSNLTLVMTLNNNANTPSANTAYFDDLCVTFSSGTPVDVGGGGLKKIEIIAIGVGAGCGVLLLLIVIVIFCSCYCCCRGKRKGDIKMMKKMSTLIKKKHSAVVKELKGTEGRHTARPDAHKAIGANDSQVELYAVADPDPEARLEESYTSYINPENYDPAANGQHSARIPSVVVERPVKSANENSVYTSLKAGTRDKDNVYQAPGSHPSSTSFQKLVNNNDDDGDDEQYVDVEPGSGSVANYMHLMARNEEMVGKTSPHGSRGHSPCPEFLPPPPPSEKQQIYENSQEVVVPSMSPSGVVRHTSSPMHSRSASQLASPTSLQSGADNQIYENSPDPVPSSTLPMFSAGSLPRSVDHNRSASPRSPRVHATAPPLVVDDDEQQIYENSEEVMMAEEEEGMEDDIYENDIPGMNQPYPSSIQTTGKQQYANLNS